MYHAFPRMWVRYAGDLTVSLSAFKGNLYVELEEILRCVGQPVCLYLVLAIFDEAE